MGFGTLLTSTVTSMLSPLRVACGKVSETGFMNYLRQMRVGQLVLTMPEGEVHVFGDMNAKPERRVEVRVMRHEFFWRLLTRGDVGFAEAFMVRDVEVDNLILLLTLLIENREHMNNYTFGSAWLGYMANKISHWGNANTIAGSARNIDAHYNLSNEMFALFLDPSMTYSCAIYKNPDDSLEQAQMNKLDAMIKKARIDASCHVLEVGSGWGSMCIRAAKTTGCKVTTITLSEEQLAVVRERVKAAGLEDKITPMLIDYRNMEGQFDRIVSCEMIEAVGAQFLPTYFAKLDSLLKPDGIIVIQAITIADQRFDAYVRGCDFIQKHIFPGSLCPSITSMVQACTNHTSLILEHLENIGPHYAPTLHQWWVNFQEKTKELEDMGFDDLFRRKFEYYFAYCEAGFATRTLGDVHLVLTRPCNTANLPVSSYEY